MMTWEKGIAGWLADKSSLSILVCIAFALVLVICYVSIIMLSCKVNSLTEKLYALLELHREHVKLSKTLNDQLFNQLRLISRLAGFDFEEFPRQNTAEDVTEKQEETSYGTGKDKS